MKRLLLLCLGILMAFLATSPEMAFGGCHSLEIYVDNSSWKPDPNSIKCKHGELGTNVRPTNPYFLIRSGSSAYVPDCEVTFRHYRYPSRTATYNFQQNFCFLEAGDINVNYISGETFKYTRHEGSFADGRAGKVVIWDL